METGKFHNIQRIGALSTTLPVIEEVADKVVLLHNGFPRLLYRFEEGGSLSVYRCFSIPFFDELLLNKQVVERLLA